MSEDSENYQDLIEALNERILELINECNNATHLRTFAMEHLGLLEGISVFKKEHGRAHYLLRVVKRSLRVAVLLSGSKSLTSENLIRELGIEKTFLEGVVMIIEVDEKYEPDVELAKDLVDKANLHIARFNISMPSIAAGNRNTVNTAQGL